MLNNKKRLIPQFTVGSLLAITASLAVGLALSLSPPSHLESWEGDMRWQQGLMYCGVALLVYELIRQALHLARQFRSTESETKTTLSIALCQRLVLATLLSGLLIFQLLLSRRVLVKVGRIEYLHVYVDFWPNLILTIAVLAAIRIFLVRRRQQLSSLTRALITGSIIVVGLACIAFFIFTDRAESVAMAHFATNGVEIRSPVSMQRTGVFPNHATEGFRSFWISAGAAIAVTVVSGLIWLHVVMKHSAARFMIIAAILFLISCVAVFIPWFVYQEFPRISPDLSSVPTPRLWSDTIAWLILLVGLATTLGLQLARIRQRNRGKKVILSSTSATGSLGVYLIAIASGWQANILLSQFAINQSPNSALLFWVWFLPHSSWGNWQNYVFTLTEAILQPEMLLSLMLFVSALSLAWQTIRQPQTVLRLPPVIGRDVVCYTLLSLALMFVALPTFAIFGACYWLGPFV